MWQLKIQDPSGETRFCQLNAAAPNGTLRLGRPDTEAEIQLRDHTLPAAIGDLKISKGRTSVFWLTLNDESPSARLADIEVRQVQLPPAVTWRLGETSLTIEKANHKTLLPTFPHGARHWKTCSDLGKKTLWTTRKAAETSLSVYLKGETGTGKEILAKLVHLWSPRATRTFVPLHCGALPLSLIESELFGHVKGAFTGAIQHRPGALIQAHNGTLFLDEIGDLPSDIQVKLLRFLENGEIRPVGSDHVTHADVRLICATHKPLEALVQQGLFRQDLYYRLASITVEIPALRERPDDIEMLVHDFSELLNKTPSPRAIHKLKTYPWPGNVRELRHAVERAAGLSLPWTSIIAEDGFDFLFKVTDHPPVELPQTEIPAGALSLYDMEKQMILRALNLTRGHRGKSAELLGIARSTLFEKLKEHRIRGPRQAF